MSKKVKIKQNILLSSFTTFKVGGEARYFYVVKDERDLKEACFVANHLNQPVLILGGGSNVLVSDEGFKGLVIKNEIRDINYRNDSDFVLVEVGAGLGWDDLVNQTIEKNLWGLENLSSIPGTVGATPVQNVGAYGVEVSDLITRVRVYDYKNNNFIWLDNEQCQFSYRNSIFKTNKGKNYFVTKVEFKLSTTPNPKLLYKDLQNYFLNQTNEPTLKEIRNAVVNIRSKKFPDLNEYGTAGSFFKNPVVSMNEVEWLLEQYPELPVFPQGNDTAKIALGYLLDKVCGLKGYKEGKVGLFKNQSLVLVNYGGASAYEIKTFAEKISQIVFKKTKIKIEWEVSKI